jgi:hypothetical protein
VNSSASICDASDPLPPCIVHLIQPISHLPAQPLFAVAHSQPQNKVDNDCSEQRDCQDCRTQAIIEATLSAHADTPRTPVKCEQRVHHSHHSNEGEESSADLSDLVAEVEEADGETAEDDGEVKP